ncbi:UNVERIFIED_CONTAM: hypothetical protein Sangu_0742300 [Sesamum angustifolium]|uniref:Uncharacterized protein n=1 Tax=Sesamum angustifolium TaxID=2727405 RepID=A0AAW2PUG4_9LAMI
MEIGGSSSVPSHYLTSISDNCSEANMWSTSLQPPTPTPTPTPWSTALSPTHHFCKFYHSINSNLERISPPLKSSSSSSSARPEPPHMAAGIYIATPSRTVVHLKHSPLLGPKPTSLAAPTLRLPHSLQKFQGIKRRKPNLTVCFVLEDEKLTRLGSRDLGEESGEE